KRPALIFFRETLASVEREFQSTPMRRQQEVRLHGLVHHIRPLALPSRVFVGTDISIRPPIKPPLLDMREVLRRQIVTQLIALLDSNPNRICPRIQMNAARIPRPRNENLMPRAVWIKAIHRR